MSDKEGSGFAILRPIAQVVEYYPRCVRLIWDASGLQAILAVGVNMLGAVVPAAQVWITKIVIDNVISAVGNADGAAVDWIGLLIPVAGVFGVWILGSICSAVANGLIEKVGYLVRTHSEYLIIRKAAQLDIAFFENPAFFDEMEKARSESSYRAYNLAALSLTIVSSLTGLIAMLAVLLSVHWAAPIILLVTAAPQVIVGGHYAGKRFSLVGAMASNRRMAEYLSRLLGSREAVKEIRIFALHEELLRRFHNFWRLIRQGNLSPPVRPGTIWFSPRIDYDAGDGIHLGLRRCASRGWPYQRGYRGPCVPGCRAGTGWVLQSVQ